MTDNKVNKVNRANQTAKVKVIAAKGVGVNPNQPEPKPPLPVFVSTEDKLSMEQVEADFKIAEQMALVKLSKNEFSLVLHHIIAGKTLKVALNKVKRHTAVQVSRRLMHIQDVPELLQAYKRARNLQGTLMADEILDISNGDLFDIANNDDSANAIARDSLKIKSRQWLAKSYNPEDFGDHVRLEVAAQEDLQTLFDNNKDRQIANVSKDIKEVKASKDIANKNTDEGSKRRRTTGNFSKDRIKEREVIRLQTFMQGARSKDTKRREL